ncbi:MAG TPA: ABC transporter ATP-binding protein [Clostridia bacterium]|nr:ABC transporter ATP-binding protein [Clostridia bacterium]
MAPILEVKNLNKSFGDFFLNEVSFTLDRGYIMGFIGPNGAGKSTTIKLIMNLLKKDSGEIRIFGMDHLKKEREIKERIGFVYDENCFYEELTVSEMKRVVSAFYKNWDDSQFCKYLKEFNLPAKKKIKQLSKGMKMKFALAIALSHQAELLIMDEPTSGLDPVVRNELLDILAWIIQDENKGILFSTHITSDLEKIADYITLIDKGRIILSRTKDELLDNYGIVKGGRDVLTSGLEKNVIGIRESKFGFEALVDDRRKADKIFKGQILIEKPSLEEIMLYYTRGK